MNHNLEALTPFDFESLSKSIFDRALGLQLQLYRQGRDGGVDLAHAWKEGELIVQCKHWFKSPVSALIREFAQVEMPKMKVLQPKRYMVSTSADLLRAEKESLAAELKPFLQDSGDIWGRSEIEHFLDENADVVRAHLRLWLGSSSTLQALLHQAEAIRSADLAAAIERDLPVFVQTAAYERAEAILGRHRLVLLSGPPGIGKTTLAHILAAELLLDGYSVVKIARDVREGYDLWADDQPQVFVYDDFLGRSARGDHFGKNEDQDLLDFTEKVASSKNKYLILTTRGYILGQAKAIYEKLNTPRISLSECLLEMKDLDEDARALILYNHVWASPLSSVEKALFTSETVYKPIIRHKNYSPRLVALSLQQPSSEMNVAEWMLSNLANPAALWHHAVQRQLSADSRQLLDLFGSLGASADLSHLRALWDVVSVPAGDPLGGRFDDAAAQLFGDFWQMGGDPAQPTVESANPSLDDYVSLVLRDNPGTLVHLARATTSFAHVRGIWRVFDSSRQRAFEAPLAVGSQASVRAAAIDAAARLLDVADFGEAGVDLSGRCRRLRFLLSLSVSEDDLRSAWELCSEILHAVSAGVTQIGPDVELGPLTDLLATIISTPLAPEVDPVVFAKIGEYLSDGYDWESASYYADVARQLAPYLDAVAERLDDRANEAAIEELSGWQGSDNGNDTPRLREVLGYAAQFDDPETFFPGYAEASSFIGSIDDYREQEYKDRRLEERSSDSGIDVRTLMAGLGDDH